jgi:hypothetical protein
MGRRRREEREVFPIQSENINRIETEIFGSIIRINQNNVLIEKLMNI